MPHSFSFVTPARYSRIVITREVTVGLSLNLTPEAEFPDEETRKAPKQESLRPYLASRINKGGTKWLLEKRH
jgi:hypothetical protein